MQQREHFYGQLKYPGGWKTCQLTPGAVIWATHHQLPHRVQALLGHDAYNPFQSTLCHTLCCPPFSQRPNCPMKGWEMVCVWLRMWNKCTWLTQVHCLFHDNLCSWRISLKSWRAIFSPMTIFSLPNNFHERDRYWHRKQENKPFVCMLRASV